MRLLLIALLCLTAGCVEPLGGPTFFNSQSQPAQPYVQPATQRKAQLTVVTADYCIHCRDLKRVLDGMVNEGLLEYTEVSPSSKYPARVLPTTYICKADGTCLPAKEGSMTREQILSLIQ